MRVLGLGLGRLVAFTFVFLGTLCHPMNKFRVSLMRVRDYVELRGTILAEGPQTQSHPGC